MSELVDPLTVARAELEGEVDRFMRLQSRTENFPLFLHFGNRALELCKQDGRRLRGRNTVATWISPLITTENGICLTVEAVTSHRKVPAESDRGPLLRDVLFPRLLPQVYEIAVRSDVEPAKRQDLYSTFVEIGDRNLLRTDIPALQGDWSAALDYVGECMDASLTQQAPIVLGDWYEQHHY